MLLHEAQILVQVLRGQKALWGNIVKLSLGRLTPEDGVNDGQFSGDDGEVFFGVRGVQEEGGVGPIKDGQVVGYSLKMVHLHFVLEDVQGLDKGGDGPGIIL